MEPWSRSRKARAFWRRLLPTSQPSRPPLHQRQTTPVLNPSNNPTIQHSNTPSPHHSILAAFLSERPRLTTRGDAEIDRAPFATPRAHPFARMGLEPRTAQAM